MLTVDRAGLRSRPMRRLERREPIARSRGRGDDRHLESEFLVADLRLCAQYARPPQSANANLPRCDATLPRNAAPQANSAQHHPYGTALACADAHSWPTNHAVKVKRRTILHQRKRSLTAVRRRSRLRNPIRGATRSRRPLRIHRPCRIRSRRRGPLGQHRSRV